MRVLSLFSGIGAFEKALDRCNINYELVNYCEIDKHASKAYSIIHNVDESKNLKDVTKIDASALPRDLDLITYGFPCQDISVAGKQKGFTDEDGSRTRSGLFFDALRIISATQPKFAIAENVKALTSKKFANEFKTVLTNLELAGYNNYYAVLNAKDYGIPQSRERVFIISIREDIDTGDFAFPTPFELKTRLKDLLEDEVDEKYYLKDSLQFFINNPLEQEAKGNGFRFEPHVKENADLAKTITTRAGGRMDDNFILDNLQTNESKFTFNKNNVDTLLVDDTQGFGSEPRIYKEYSPTLRSSRQGLKIIQVCNLVTMNGDYKGTFDNPQSGRVYSSYGLSPTLTTMRGGGLEPKIITHNIKQQVKVRKYEVDSKKLVEVLREQKQKTGLTNKQLSEKLNLPLTKIEHWFRQDNSFAIPDADIWFELKKLLNIETNEFDLPITQFEYKDNIFEKSNRCYHEHGLSPTLTSTSADEKIITNFRVRKLTPKECWRLMGFDDEDIDKCVAAGLSNSQLYKMAGNSIVVNCIEEIYKRLFKG